MEKYETQIKRIDKADYISAKPRINEADYFEISEKNRINEADYIDITVFIRAFLRLARRYLILVCPIIVCLSVCMNLLSRALVKERCVAEASFVVGVTLLDDYSYNYTLAETRNDYIAQMSAAFRSVINSEYMVYLLHDELKRDVPGEVFCKNVYGTNMGDFYAISDSMENAKQLRDAVITCLPKALFTTIGDVELKVLETTERTEVLHENLKSPLLWGGVGVVGGVFAYLGIIFLATLWRQDIETPEDMHRITDLPCLGRLLRSRNKGYNRSFSAFRRHLADTIEQKQIKTLLFTGENKKRGQKKLLNKLNHDWISRGKKVMQIDMAYSKVPDTGIQIREELNQQIENAMKEADLLIINGPDFEKTVELLTMADCVDGIVYIVKAGYDQMENTKEAVSTLGFTQAELIGYVITT